MKIALLCGGPSKERGISLNSARSVQDHLGGEDIDISPIYFDPRRHAYLLSPGQLYSNTPSDFDFRLSSISKPLTPRQLECELRAADLVFPAIHGQFGEDGGVQSLLEKIGVPFVGSSSEACKRCFDKFNANEYIREHGFCAPPSAVLKIYKENHKEIIEEFFVKNSITRAVVKPATGGSSIGVFSVSTPEEALEKATLLFSKRMDTRVVLEPFAKGVEFTVIILENSYGIPVALIPTEIEADYHQHQIFDYRKKYLPTRQVVFHCPPRFPSEVIDRIRVYAEQLFKLFGMHDVARFDGWLLENGEIWFSDFNPVSGMEQNSFLFQQGARVGMSHSGILRYIVESSCKRQGIPFTSTSQSDLTSEEKKKVAVVFGGLTSERQVSLMSGTNVWLKLKRSEKFHPEPYLMESLDSFVRVPYALLLNHTIEEILQGCRSAEIDAERLTGFINQSRLRLGFKPQFQGEAFFLPERYSLAQLTTENDFVFLALHGGAGEDGTVQSALDALHSSYNGSGAITSLLCSDKYETSQQLRGLESEGITVADKLRIETASLESLQSSELTDRWDEICSSLRATSLIVKPMADGCSSGIVRLNSASDLRAYIEFISVGVPRIPAGRFPGQTDPVEMPSTRPDFILFECFIETDKVRVVGSELRITDVSGWVEVTIGVLEREGRLHALHPSITVADGDVLSLEEKFQGGTGINITPPPEEIISTECCDRVKERTERVATALGIQGYARIDLFVERTTGKILVIEANTLPGLTPSTVLFHQGLAEEPPLAPLVLLEEIIEVGLARMSPMSNPPRFEIT